MWGVLALLPCLVLMLIIAPSRLCLCCCSSALLLLVGLGVAGQVPVHHQISPVACS